MITRKLAAITGLLLTAEFAFADASYQTTSQVTGGQFVDNLRSVSFLSKQMEKAFAPTSHIVMVHGNQKADVSKDFTQIIDLDKGQMIFIDHNKKTYYILTFAQMAKQMANVSQQMQKVQQQSAQPQTQPPQNIKIDFDTKVDNTGVTKVVNGFTAQEQIITVKMTATSTDPAAVPPGQPNSFTYTVTTDAWITPDPPEMKEIQDFDVRMAQKMMQGMDTSALMQQWKQNANNGNAAMAQMFGGHPGASEAMAQMAKETAKIKGTRILEVMSMGGDVPAQAGTANTTAAPSQPQSQQQGSVAGQVATDTATQTAAGESGRLGVVGSALANSTLSAFRRKKASTPPAAQTTTTSSAATSGTASSPQKVVLMEMTEQKTNFSRDAVPSSAFQIPAGYKQVQLPNAQ
jgi:hypothetical protein